MFKNLSLKTFAIRTEMRESLRLATLGQFEAIDIEVDQVAEMCQKHSSSYIKGMFDSFDIRPTAWYLPFDISLPAPDFQQEIEHLKAFLPRAQEINALRVLALLPSGSDTSPYKDFCCLLPQRISAIAGLLEQYGCRIGIEIPSQQYVKPYKHIYSFSLDQVVDLCKTAACINAGIVFDTFLWHREGSKIETLQKLNNGNIIYVKASDQDNNYVGRCLPGRTNTVNLPLVMKTLTDIKYDGPVTPVSEEPRMTCLPHEIAVILSGGYLSYIWKKFITQT